MSEKIRRLPDAEQEVMQALWSCKAPASRQDIEAVLFEKHIMATTTLLTMLTRLCDKGFVKIEKSGRRSVYTPLVSREKYLAARSHSFFQNLCGGNLSVFANALCNSGLSDEDLSQLRDLLEREEL